MSDLEKSLNAEFDAWFAKVQAIAGKPLEPSPDWAAFWFDGYTPEEALGEEEDED